MNLSLRPEVERMIDEEVKAGRFPAPEAFVEAAITYWHETSTAQLDDATIDAINQAEDQADRGEGIDLDAFRAHMTRRANGK